MQTKEKDLNEVATTDVDEAVEAMDDSGQSSKEETKEDDSSVDEEIEESLEKKEESEPEEDIEELKARLLKTERDRDNYRKGMLSAKAKDRALPIEVEKKGKETNEDEIEQRVSHVLAKREQRIALTSVLDPSSTDYIPELSAKDQYNDIIGYLPQNYDRTSAESVKRAFRVATAAWKFDRGIVDKKKPKGPTDAGLSGGDSTITTRKEEPTLNIPKQVPITEWFK